MSSVSAKQRVEQLKDWFNWLGSVSRRNGSTAPKKVKEKVAFEGKKEYFKKKS